MSYREAWVAISSQKDATYLYLFLAVLVGFYWYRWWLHRRFKLVLATSIFIIGLALLWGILH